MLVTFVSECEKQAIKKTQRVLDSFAIRIGHRTWQTLITEDGLISVKELLKKSATKSTAVSCHRMVTRNRSELEWIVGNRRKFNQEGAVAVNLTKNNAINAEWENNWYYLPLIRALTALAALFHDWGKVSEYFQEKLNPRSKNAKRSDPLRHEWISMLFFSGFVSDATCDEEWLDKLQNSHIGQVDLKQTALKFNLSSIKPLAAKLITWLIITHHKLPVWIDEDCGSKRYAGDDFEIDKFFKAITEEWQYKNPENFHDLKDGCLKPISNRGSLLESEKWLSDLKRWARKLSETLHLLQEAEQQNLLRVIMLYSRLSLMLGDHNYSSKDRDDKWQTSLQVYANTDKDGNLKQKLDEHLVGVKNQALKIVQYLPNFETSLAKAYDVRDLKKKAKDHKYKWQDKAVEKIKLWQENLSKVDQTKYGFFAVNIASTGCGKTLANAKIMRAISDDQENLRYILALGLRTLTLQTGDEYRERLGLTKSDLAVLIGSKAVLDLHEKNKQDNKDVIVSKDRGSESEESLLSATEQVRYEGNIESSLLDTVLEKKKHKQFLYAPVLSCTIDHLVSAVTCKRGGRYILPTLRLMSSDLVIDEIDDFTGDDLIIIGRLIHLAGLLGRKVMISSATIPPDMAIGYFYSYTKAYKAYAASRKINALIGSAWIDEFTTCVESVDEISQYQDMHKKFVSKRVVKLFKQPIKKPVRIVQCAAINDQKSEVPKWRRYFELIKENIVNLHTVHGETDKSSGKKVSFGVIRVANITPCVNLTQYLLEEELIADDVEIKVMAYHSRQVLLLRSEQERFLDNVLKRKNPNSGVSNFEVQRQLKSTTKRNVIFIVVATPVEEVGRDHDFDWAIIEPSSFRSIIQLAGRVLRHRDIVPNEPNIAIMEYNLRCLKNGDGKACFNYPGYERDVENYRLVSHSLQEVIKEDVLRYGINAIPRIKRSDNLEPNKWLDDLEHYAISELLSKFENKGPESLSGWIDSAWWMTGLPQQYCKFRKDDNGKQDRILYRRIGDKGEFVFQEKSAQGSFESANEINNIEQVDFRDDFNRLWLRRDYLKLLEKHVHGDVNDQNINKIASKYGEIALPHYRENQPKYYYNDQLGLWEK